MQIHSSFPRYTEYNPQVPVWCVTPNQGGYLHRFFDTTPISPSGRYLACLRVPQEIQPIRPGDEAQVIVVDLQTGQERTVYTTRGWEAQMGANINWGKDDSTLLFNDLDVQTWKPFGVKLDWMSGKRDRFEHGIYHGSPDGRFAVVGDLTTMRRTQGGYGVVIPDSLVPRRNGAPADTGVYLTDVETGNTRMLISIQDAYTRATPYVTEEDLCKLESYVFHTKFSPDGQRIMFTIRRRPIGLPDAFAIRQSKVIFDVFTISPDGSRLFNPIPYPYWMYSGHHTTWTPDSRHLTFNLDLHRKGMKLWKVREDGSDFGLLVDFAKGSGHPTLHRDGRHVITDTYLGEGWANEAGAIPLRWLDLEKRTETHPVRICIKSNSPEGEWRIDAHPAWDKTWRYVSFNGAIGANRKVFIADMQPLLG